MIIVSESCYIKSRCVSISISRSLCIRISLPNEFILERIHSNVLRSNFLLQHCLFLAMRNGFFQAVFSIWIPFNAETRRINHCYAFTVIFLWHSHHWRGNGGKCDGLFYRFFSSFRLYINNGFLGHSRYLENKKVLVIESGKPKSLESTSSNYSNRIIAVNPSSAELFMSSILFS